MNIPAKAPACSPRQEVLAGLVERVTYHNAENGFCVLRIKARGHRDLVTAVGHAATVSAGESAAQDLRPQPSGSCVAITGSCRDAVGARSLRPCVNFSVCTRPANHSFNFDQRRRPDTLRTAMAAAFFWPTSTTSRLPRVTPV